MNFSKILDNEVHWRACGSLQVLLATALVTGGLEWVAIPFLRRFFSTQGSTLCLLHCRQFYLFICFTIWATREALYLAWKQFCSCQKPYSVQFSSVAQLCLTLWDPRDCSTPGFPVHQQLPELVQTHVHWVGDAIQLSHPLLSPSPAFNLSQHQGLLQWVSSLHQVAKVLVLQL